MRPESPLSIRRAILLYLEDAYDFKPMNDFLKGLNVPLGAIISTLSEMYSHWEGGSGIVDIRGDYAFLGQKFAELKDIGKALSGTESFITDPEQRGFVLSKGIGNLDNCSFVARITHKGREELERFRTEDSIRKVNESVIKTNQATLAFAFVAAISSVLALFSNSSDKPLVQEIQSLNSTLQEQMKILENLLGTKKDKTFQGYQSIDSVKSE